MTVVSKPNDLTAGVGEIVAAELSPAEIGSDKLDRINLIDDLLPQTQCGQCGFVEGCRPYAAAMVLSDEPANLCVPGGQPLADQLAKLLGQALKPAAPSRWPLDPVTAKPVEVEAVIDEALCIGCYKCVTACPVDAIVGAAKLMHTVIASDCTGCELCLEPCPVDCIDLIEVSTQKLSQPHLRLQFKTRYARHQSRLSNQIEEAKGTAPIVSAKQTQASSASASSLSAQLSASSAKARIEAAKLRTQLAKLKRQQVTLMDRARSDTGAADPELDNLNAEIQLLEARLNNQPSFESPPS